MTPSTTPSAAPETAKPLFTAEGIYFMPSLAKARNTLFRPVQGRTAMGYYKLTPHGIRFYDMAGSPFAFLVANRHGERFFVSCSRGAKGKLFYMFSTTDADSIKLGIKRLGYAATCDLADSLWHSFQPQALAA